MPIKVIPFTQLKEIMELNKYYEYTSIKPKTKCVKKNSTIKNSIDRYNKNYTIFGKINNLKSSNIKQNNITSNKIKISSDNSFPNNNKKTEFQVNMIDSQKDKFILQKK